MDAGSERHRLRKEIERALRAASDPADVLPRLARLAELAPEKSDDGVFANVQLAELLVERHPWRAAVYARRALTHCASNDRAWAVLAFCHTLLGNFRAAVAAYKSALACAPANPWYAHNLGQLLDVALGQPRRALPWLERAHTAKGDNSEIVASYVHALGRAGCIATARPILARAIGRFPSHEFEALMRWLDHPECTRTPFVHGQAPGRDTSPRAKIRSRVSNDARLTQLLIRGLSHLPLDAKQRDRALALARDALATRPNIPPRSRTNHAHADDAGLAAAVAYAIVFVDRVPLSHAEVAAPFRVAVGHLRGRFAELRAWLDLIPGDARYATPCR